MNRDIPLSLPDDVTRLKQVSFLSVLDEESLRLIAFNSVSKQAVKGSILFREGERASGAFFLLEGSISMSVPPATSGDRAGGERSPEVSNDEKVRKNVVTTLPIGSIIDPLSLIVDGKRSGTAEVLEDASYLILDRDTFLRVLENYPEMAERVYDYMCSDFNETVKSLNFIASRLDFIG